MAEQQKETVIQDGTEFEGTMRSKCAVSLSGRLKGQLNAPALHVTQSGAVEGDVKVAQLKSTGEVSGRIEAESVELSGRVNDQTVIKAKVLQVQLTPASGGVQVSFGNCELQVGEKPHVPGKPEGAQIDRPAKKPTAATAENVTDVVANLLK